MTRIATLVVVGCAIACGCDASESQGESKQSQKDGGAEGAPAPGGGLGMMGTLLSAKAGEPGPYEAPRESEDFAEDKEHVEVLELSGSMVELESLSLFGGISGTEHRGILEVLREMGQDESVSGLLLRVNDFSLDLPKAEGLRAALLAFKSSGEKERELYCYVERAGDAVYYLLTACDRIAVPPNGGLSITGPAAIPIHLKGLLGKLGISADFLHIGEYKGAAEPLTREAPSPEMMETLRAIIDARYAVLVSGIAKGRDLSAEKARELIDTALFDDDDAVEAGLADEVATYRDFRDEALGETPWRTRKLESQAVPTDMSKVMELVGLVPRKRPTEPHVALVYAVGNVVEGKGQGTLGARSEIAARTLSEALRALGRDDSVKAVVLRIDSGGGSALASEIIWQAVTEVKKGKPVVVSMGSAAASGGYYIASAGTKIFAAKSTLTGSIGVVGGKLVLSEGLDKIGVKVYPIGKGKRSLIWSSVNEWTKDERAAIRDSMKSVYDRFIARVAESRSMSPEAVEEVAKGRVWTGKAALDLGLIDAIGGLEDALGEARRLAELPAEAPLEVYPPEPTLLDLLQGLQTGGVTLSGALEQAAASVERELGSEAGAAARLILSELSRFQRNPIRAVTLLPAAIR